MVIIFHGFIFHGIDFMGFVFTELFFMEILFMDDTIKSPDQRGLSQVIHTLKSVIQRYGI